MILTGARTRLAPLHLVLILRILLLDVFKVAPRGPLVIGDFDAFKTSTCNELLLWLIEVVFLGVRAGSNRVLCRLSRLDKRTGPGGARPVPIDGSFGRLFDMVVHDLIGAWSDSTRIIHQSTHLAYFLFICVGCSCIDHWRQEARRYAWN